MNTPCEAFSPFSVASLGETTYLATPNLNIVCES